MEKKEAKISYVNGYAWAEVSTDDERKCISVSVDRLLYDEDERAYLLAFCGENELRLYID